MARCSIGNDCRDRNGAGRDDEPDGSDAGPLPALPAPHPARDSGEQLWAIGGRGAHIAHRRRQRIAELVAHESSSASLGSCKQRSFASAFAVWLFTVPTEQPSIAAVSASDRSSQ